MNDYMVDRQKWSQLSIFEQMGNIYSEVGRSLKARQRQDTAGSEAAVRRATDLFDATAGSLAGQRSPRAKEVLRANEQYLAVMDAPHP